jgi:hypothetical protein
MFASVPAPWWRLVSSPRRRYHSLGPWSRSGGYSPADRKVNGTWLKSSNWSSRSPSGAVFTCSQKSPAPSALISRSMMAIHCREVSRASRKARLNARRLVMSRSFRTWVPTMLDHRLSSAMPGGARYIAFRGARKPAITGRTGVAR